MAQFGERGVIVTGVASGTGREMTPPFLVADADDDFITPPAMVIDGGLTAA